MATTYLNKTPLSGSTSTGTFSAWIKRANLGAQMRIFAGFNDASNFTAIHFTSGDALEVVHQDSGGYIYRYITDKLFRDVSGWYNIVVQFDLTNGVAGDRVKIYVNGVLETSFSTETNPSDAAKTMDYNDSSATNLIGQMEGGGFFSGSMSYFIWVDGTAYTASTFGSTDSDTGEWKINTSPTVTYGTNGFLIMKDGNTITDQSGGSNDWTLGAGALTKTEDCPDDVFATMNILDSYWPTTSADSVFTYGNNQVVSGTGSSSANGYSYNNATMAVSKGKFYWEVKATSVAGSSFIGIISRGQLYNQNLNEILNSNAYAWAIANSTGSVRNNNTTTTYAASYTTNDIISVALDLDNNKIYWAKNGDWGDGSGSWDSSTFDAAVGDLAITAPASVGGNGHYFPTVGASDYGTSSTWQTNFGNGYFGTTAISSAGTNASDIGLFEYDVPTGFTALSTKGLQE
jgi:hypothetical protein